MHLLIQKFLLHLRGARKVSAHTLRAYTKDLADLEKFSGEAAALGAKALTRSRLRDYLAHLQQGARYKRNTVLRKFEAVRSWIRFLVEEGDLESNPLAGIPTPKKESRLPRYLTEEEVMKLLDSPARAKPPLGPRDRAILELLYSSGLRRSELCGLNIGDVDFLAGFTRVMGKGSKERWIPVGKTALRCLKDYLALRPAMKDPGGEALFVSARGRRLSSSAVPLILSRWAREARLYKPVTPHMLRHSFATHLLDRGCDLKSLQEMLGHRNLSTTQVYTHISMEHLRKIYQKAHPRV